MCVNVGPYFKAAVSEAAPVPSHPILSNLLVQLQLIPVPRTVKNTEANTKTVMRIFPLKS